MTSPLLAAVDIGKTSARAVVVAHGQRGDVHTAPGHRGLAAAGGVEAVAALTVRLVRRLDPVDQIGTVVVGVPGALTAPARVRACADAIAAALPGIRVAVASDAITAHCGALSGRPGVVATLGTGVSVLGLGVDGEFVLVDGRGFEIGDAGGGADIGRAGVRAALRAHDGAAPQTALTVAAARRFGELTGLAALFSAADNPARLAASFAPDVAAAAAAGDGAAETVLDEAATEIAASIRAAYRRAGTDLPVVVTGGMVQLGAPLLDRLGAALDDLDLQSASGDALDGAALLGDETRDTAWAGSVQWAESLPEPLLGGDDSLGRLATERPRAGADWLERLPTAELVAAFLDHETEAVTSLRRDAPAVLAPLVDEIAERMARGGRLLYAGAGTPGRLGYLDAAECEPTFGVPPGLVVALIAGGERAVRRAVEGAEDDPELGARDVVQQQVGPLDALVGIAASGRTPYVIGALQAARAAGALTLAVANTPGSEIGAVAEHVLEIDSGPEVITGSTRLAAGTTQKLVLNTLSSSVMVRLGKTYRGRMVDVVATNEKLQARVRRIVRELADVDESSAETALADANGEAKTAVVALLTDRSPDAARAALRDAGGHVDAVVERAR